MRKLGIFHNRETLSKLFNQLVDTVDNLPKPKNYDSQIKKLSDRVTKLEGGS